MTNHEPAPRKRRGRKRHGHKRWRLLSLLIGLLCVGMGALFLVWSSADGNGGAPRRFGLLYFALGGGLLAAYAILSGSHRVGLMRGSTVRAGEKSRQGMALLMALLLTALLSGAVLHSLMSAHMTLRSALVLRGKTLLRIAATDAALDAIKNTAAGDPGTSISERTFEARLPSGIATKTTLRPLDRAAVPAILTGQKVPLFGSHFAVTSAARDDRRTWEVQSVGCRLPSGDVRILCWIEPL